MEESLTGQQRKTAPRVKFVPLILRRSSRRLKLPEPQIENEDSSSSDSDERSLSDIKMEEDSANEDDPLADVEDPLADGDEQFPFKVSSKSDQATVSSDSTAKSKGHTFSNQYIIDSTTGKYKCPNCSKKFSTCSEFDAHFNTVHLKSRWWYECDTCGKQFMTKPALANHQRKSGSVARQSKSSDPKMATSKINTGVKFQCSGWKKTFSVEKSLQNHHQMNISGTKYGSKSKAGKEGCVVPENEDFQPSSLSSYQADETSLGDEMSEGSGSNSDTPGNKITPEPNTKSTPKSSIDCDRSSTTGRNISEGTKRVSPSPPKVANKIASSSSSDSTGVGVPVPRSRVDPETGRHKCSRCSLEFETTPLFESHYKSTHLNDRYECPLCGEDLPQTMEGYLTHYRSVHMHTGVKSNICNKTVSLSLSTKHRLEKDQLEPTQVEHENVDTGTTEIKMEDDSADDEAGFPDVGDQDPDDRDPFADNDDQLADEQVSSSSQGLESKSKDETEVYSQNYIIDPTTGKYKCRLCSLEYSGNSGVLEHYESVHLKIRYKCDHCDETFARRPAYNRHKQNVHMGVRYKCSGCEELFTLKASLRKHQQRSSCVTKEFVMVHLAEIADEDLEENDDLANEGGQLKDEQVSTQARESKSKGQTELPNQNYSIDSTTGTYKCRLCSLEYSGHSGVLNHYNSVHLKIRYKCDHCEKTFGARPAYNRHKQNVHMGVRYRCSGCEELFTLKSSLQKHQQRSSCMTKEFVLVHLANDTDEEDLKAMDHLANKESQLKDGQITTLALESKSKSEAEVSNQYYSIDPTTRKYKCRVCSKEYSGYSGVQKHYTSVHLKLRLKCDHCEKTFARRPDYNRHKQNVHMGVRHKCSGCEKLFTMKKTLREHQQRGCCETNELGVGSTEVKIERDSSSEEDPLEEDEEIYSQNQTITRRPGNIQLSRDVNAAPSFKCNRCEKLYTTKKSFRRHQLETVCGSGTRQNTKNEDSRLADGKEGHNGYLADKGNISKRKSRRIAVPPPPIRIILKTSPSSSSASTSVEHPIQPINMDPESGRAQTTCNLCLLEFSNKKCLKHHLKVRYECVLCRTEFCQRNLYFRHYKSSHMGMATKFKCDICSKTFFTKYHLKKHQGSHNRQKRLPLKLPSRPRCRRNSSSLRPPLISMNPETGRFHCTLCPEEFEGKMSFRSHYLNNHRGYQVKCDICDKMFRKTISLKRHQLLHKKDPTVDTPLLGLNPETKRFHCPLCPKKFYNYEGFRLHHRSIHLQIRYDCRECGKRFGNKQYLKRHHQKVHLGLQCTSKNKITERHKCHQCEKSYARRYYLSLHLRSGTCGAKEGFGMDLEGPEDPKHLCPECGKVLSSKQSLNAHRQSMHFGSQFECEVCKKSYKWKFTLYQHHRNTSCGTAMGLEPTRPSVNNKNLCPECGKEFTSNGFLQRHRESMHLGIKFECEVCKKSFKWKFSLEEHHRRTSCGAAALSLKLSPSPTKIICHLCGKDFAEVANLLLHLTAVHSTGPKHKCEHCEKAFQRGKDLVIHTQSAHLGIRFDCKNCGKSFTQKTQLQTHHRWTACAAALGMKPAPMQNCQFCGKEFNCRDVLRLHVKQDHPEHKAEKKFPCDSAGCGKFFLSASHMRVHYNGVHLGVRKPTKPKKK